MRGSLFHGIGLSFALLVAPTTVRAEVQVALADLVVDGLRAEQISCRLRKGGPSGPKQVLSLLSQERAALALCAPGVRAVNIQLSMQGSTIDSVYLTGAGPSASACATERLRNRPIPLAGTCNLIVYLDSPAPPPPVPLPLASPPPPITEQLPIQGPPLRIDSDKPVALYARRLNQTGIGWNFGWGSVGVGSTSERLDMLCQSPCGIPIAPNQEFSIRAPNGVRDSDIFLIPQGTQALSVRAGSIALYRGGNILLGSTAWLAPVGTLLMVGGGIAVALESQRMVTPTAVGLLATGAVVTGLGVAGIIGGVIMKVRSTTTVHAGQERLARKRPLHNFYLTGSGLAVTFH